MRIERRILLAASALGLALVGMVVREDRARASGQEVLLAMEAVDPRSLLAGHYAALTLTERLPAGQLCPERRDGRWIALAPSGDHHRFIGAGTSRDAAERLGPVVLKGGFTCSRIRIDRPPASVPETDGGRGDSVMLDIGVTRFHADQDEAQAMERALQNRQPGAAARDFAVVSVGRDGRARLKGVVLDGRRTDLTWF